MKEAENGQRHNLFQTREKVHDKVVKVIIDGASCHNLASHEMTDKLGLKLLRHPHPYHVQWLNDSGDIKIGYKLNVPFKIGEYCRGYQQGVPSPMRITRPSVHTRGHRRPRPRRRK